MAWLRRPAGSGWLIATLVVAACGSLGQRSEPPSQTAVPVSALPWVNPFLVSHDTAARYGAFVRLLDSAPFDSVTARVVAPSPLSERTTAELLKLVGPAPESTEPAPFRFMSRSLPAPRPGTTIRGVPVGAGNDVTSPALTAAGPLRVLHTAPRGDVATASQVAIVFSRPMIRLGSGEGAPAGVRLMPTVEGEWRWLDPATLVFDAVGGLPGSTRFTVDVPAGLRASDGERLRERSGWTFSTSTPRISHFEAIHVKGKSAPALAVTFDQRIDPAAVFPLLRVEVDGRAVPLKPISAEALEGSIASYRVNALPLDRTLILQPQERLRSRGNAREVEAVLRLVAGVPSLEGPLRSDTEQSQTITIPIGFTVMDHRCGRAPSCAPGTPWTIQFNVPVRSMPDTASWVRVEPELPGATIEVWGTNIVVLGAAEPNTTYTVHLDSMISGWPDVPLGPVAPLQFEVGDVRPAIHLPGLGIAAIPSDSKAAYSVLTEGVDSLNVRVLAVSPHDWSSYNDRVRTLPFVHSGSIIDELPGRELARRTVPVKKLNSGPDEAFIDLASELDTAGGHVILMVEPSGHRFEAADDEVRAAVTWVQRAPVLLDVAEDGEQLTVRVTSPAGSPLKDVAVSLQGTVGDTARTSESGVAVLPNPGDHKWVIEAHYDNSVVLFPLATPLEQYCCARWEWLPSLRSHFLTDRPIYAPLDTVRFVGWLRRAEGLGLEPMRPSRSSRAVVTMNDPRGEELGVDTIRPDADGRIAGQFVLPVGANTGFGSVSVQLLDSAAVSPMYEHFSYQVQEVRRPTFDVVLNVDSVAWTVGDTVDVAATATYFTGGGLPDTRVTWQVSSGPAWYTPPGAASYSFGQRRRYFVENVPSSTHSGTTDSEGRHSLSIVIDSIRPGIAMSLLVNSSVTDLDRQHRTATTSLIVHPADVYVGLRTAASFVRVGEPLVIDAIVVDVAGVRIVDRPIDLVAQRQNRNHSGGQLTITESVHGGCTLRSMAGPVRCRFTDLPAGDYVIVAIVEDSADRRSVSEIPVRVAGETIGVRARAAMDSVLMQPDRTEYEPGDTALIAVDAPESTTSALLTIRRAGVLDVVPLEPGRSSAIARVPIVDAFVPNVQFHVVASTSDGGTVDGHADVTITPRTRRLNVVVEPEVDELAPGGSTRVVVTITDDAGRPVPDAAVVLSGVDESLAALSWQRTADPVERFYPETGPGVLDRSIRARLVAHGVATTAADTGAVSGGAISGLVVDWLSGRPLARAWVETTDGHAGTWTRADGSYSLEGLLPGEYAVQARVNGFVTRQARVRVERAATTRSHFLLRGRGAMLARAESRFMALREVAALGDAVSLNQLVVSGELNPRSAAAQMRMANPVSLLRTNLSPVAAFVVDAQTGDDGRAVIPIALPDNITRYTLHVSASAADRQFGSGESAITARRPLMVRATPPRFLNRDDRFELPVLVENRTTENQTVDVAVRAQNAVLSGSHGQRVMVPAQDRVELRFHATAGEPGDARFQIIGVAVDNSTEAVAVADTVVGRGAFSDGIDIRIPVIAPAVVESYAVYGQVDDSRPVAYPVRLPIGAVADHSRVELGFATTAAHGLRDAILFLLDCPFDLPEATASRILALSELRGLPAAMPVPSDAIEARIRADIAQLVRLQLHDGSWSIWPAMFDADPFVSVHVMHALQRAAAAGFAVPDNTMERAVEWLEHMDPQSAGAQRPRVIPAWSFENVSVEVPPQARLAIQAYALNVRHRLGHDVAASSAALLETHGAQSFTAEALAWLLPSIAGNNAYAVHADDVRREIAARVVRSAGTASIVSPYDAGARAVYYSPRRSDAVVLEALVNDEADADLLAPIARGLMAHRVRGYWQNTQENAFSVVALAAFFRQAEAVEPDFTVRAWSDDRLTAEHTFAGRSDARYELAIPTDSLGKPGDEIDVIVSREGSGRLYYRVGVNYVIAGLAEPIARGFRVERSYEAVDDSSDVRRLDDGTWIIRHGARVRVRVLVENAGPRYHVAVVDPLPAGFEAVNYALAGTAVLRMPRVARNRATADPPAEWFPARHINARNDRYETFTLLLPPGRHEVEYLALATTAGEFTAPAARAEEMYSPETRGRAAAERVVVRSVP